MIKTPSSRTRLPAERSPLLLFAIAIEVAPRPRRAGSLPACSTLLQFCHRARKSSQLPNRKQMRNIRGATSLTEGNFELVNAYARTPQHFQSHKAVELAILSPQPLSELPPFSHSTFPASCGKSPQISRQLRLTNIARALRRSPRPSHVSPRGQAPVQCL